MNPSPIVDPACRETVSLPFTSSWRTRLTDYVELSKLRISVMVLATVVMGFVVGGGSTENGILLLNSLMGIGLIAAASSMFNQVIEKRTDLLMPRTQNRPIPAGRVLPFEAIACGTACGVIGFFQLWLFVNPLTAILTLSTLVMYVCLYTPLKRYSSFCTTIGAIPGAMPPVLGFAAASNTLSMEALWLFAIMFLWQFPHFLAIAWLYREQYAAAGLHMLPGQLPRPHLTGLIAICYAVALLIVSLGPVLLESAGLTYAAIAGLSGLVYLGYTIRFAREESRFTARQLLFCSLFYLPIVLIAATVALR